MPYDVDTTIDKLIPKNYIAIYSKYIAVFIIYMANIMLIITHKCFLYLKYMKSYYFFIF